jgi:hypothetical protein
LCQFIICLLYVVHPWLPSQSRIASRTLGWWAWADPTGLNHKSWLNTVFTLRATSIYDCQPAHPYHSIRIAQPCCLRTLWHGTNDVVSYNNSTYTLVGDGPSFNQAPDKHDDNMLVYPCPALLLHRTVGFGAYQQIIPDAMKMFSLPKNMTKCEDLYFRVSAANQRSKASVRKGRGRPMRRGMAGRAR